MGVAERVSIFGGPLVATFQKFGLDRAGHSLVYRNTILARVKDEIDVAIEAGMTVAIVNGNTNDKKQDPAMREVIAAELKRKAPEVTIITFSYDPPGAVPSADKHFKREGSTDDFFLLGNFISRIPRR